MENFVVSARKYRPSSFDTVIGQPAIVRTLKNAIKTGQLAQAFLFCGSRGVGKTTCARILAKTINCSNRTEDTEACNQCDSCNSFNDGNSLNIHELDAASNNSVDDIRSLIDQVRFAPQIGTHKIYIIDEVHMLSNQAFNAFLKTLEEPPSHALFILATTEKHKIIPTILSRCQIFDFNRIGVNDISNHLKSIAQKEEISFEEEALNIIAQKADGALRDALSIFDQLASFTSNNLTYDAVIENLNILDYDYYFKSTDHIISEDIPNLLLLLNEVIKNGFEPQLFIQGLASHLRNLLVCKDTSTVSLIEVSDSIKERYLNQSQKIELSVLLKALDACRQCDMQYRDSKNKRLLVELTLMQIASISESTHQIQKKKTYLKSATSVNNKPKPITPEKPQNQVAEDKEEYIPESKPIENIDTQKSEIIEEVIDVKQREEIIPKREINFKAKTSLLSISELTKASEVEEGLSNEEKNSIEKNLDFTNTELDACWKELQTHFKDGNKEGDSIVYSALIRHKPILNPDNSILLMVDNKSQLEEVKYKRTEIHDFLRSKLQNNSIELELKIEKDKSQKKAYTPEEKFNELAKLNPKLNHLKDKLDLEFI